MQIGDLVGPLQPKTKGLIDVDVDLSGSGLTLHHAAASAAGSATMRVHHGTLPSAAASLVGGDALRAIGSLGDSDQALTLRCASVSFRGAEGRLKTTSVAIETPAGTTNGGGWIDLGQEQLQLTLLGTPRRKQLFRVALPILIHGSFHRPAVTALPARNAQVLGLQGKRGVALSPLAAMIPMGQQPQLASRPCGQLLARRPTGESG